jgi:hypothetical protein
VSHILVENTISNKTPMSPIFYSGQRIHDYTVTREQPAGDLFEKISNKRDIQPRFFLFLEPDNLDERVSNMKDFYPNIVYDATIRPGLVDRVLFWLNPANANQTIIIYRNRDFYP